MKQFMSRYSYESVHLFLNQFAIGLFGITLSLAAGMAKNEVLRTVTSVFSIIFFLFLQYIAMWKVGANDRLSADLGKLKKDYSVPFKMWLLSNSLNLLLALLVSLAIWFEGVGPFDSIGGVATVVIKGRESATIANPTFVFITPGPMSMLCIFHILNPFHSFHHISSRLELSFDALCSTHMYDSCQ